MSEVPEKSYWNGCGRFQYQANQLQKLIPHSGSVRNPEHTKLEKFRVASNCYYDLYNNGLGNRSKEFAKTFKIKLSRFRKYRFEFEPELFQLLELKMDVIVFEAALEQNVSVKEGLEHFFSKKQIFWQTKVERWNTFVGIVVESEQLRIVEMGLKKNVVRSHFFREDDDYYTQEILIPLHLVKQFSENIRNNIRNNHMQDTVVEGLSFFNGKDYLQLKQEADSQNILISFATATLVADALDQYTATLPK